jgi:nicotinamide phosphoribosyltransferase
MHYGDYTDQELDGMSIEDLVKIIKDYQMSENFIIMTDSYKMTHHLLLPSGLQEVYSYMEPRGGEMPYTILFGLQYYIKKYYAGVRITPAKIEEARRANIAHFGFDCFNADMWNYIWEKHGGYLPLEIKAVPEGLPIATRNIILSIRNTDPNCAALTNITETNLMKLWATNTVASYARIMKTLITKYWKKTSDLPKFLVDYMHHCFGYRGVSSEESAGLLGMAGLTSFKGTDTMRALSFAKKYYNEEMAGFSVIASEHSVVCSFGGRSGELEFYRNAIRTVKSKFVDANPPSGVIILSLVSDTWNIYNVCYNILPQLSDEFIGWTNNNGIPLKIVVRPDSGDAGVILFGCSPKNRVADKVLQSKGFGLIGDIGFNKEEAEFVAKLSIDITFAKASDLYRKGIFWILYDAFGGSVNSKGYVALNPQIGILQGDGVDYMLAIKLFDIMDRCKIDTMNLVLGSGGKFLQANDRDKQKYAIKATNFIIDGVSVPVEKDPITDSGKRSKHGYMILVCTNPINPTWKDYVTIQSGDPSYDVTKDIMRTVFLNGVPTIECDLSDVRNNGEILDIELEWS